MARNAFGDYLKKSRLAQRLTLREFCERNKLDAGNYSRLERGLYPPPQTDEAVAKYARALGLEEGADQWIELFDLAAASRGQLPTDLLSDEELLEKLPALFQDPPRHSRLGGRPEQAN